jgi:hypothetical protein
LVSDVLTVATQLKVHNIAHADVDDAEKALITPLELALVEDLDGDDGGFFDISATKDNQLVLPWRRPTTCMSKLSFQYGFRVFLMTLVV